MKQFLLATALIALPVAAFAAAETFLLPAAAPTVAAAADPLGDLSPYETIVADTRVIAKTGDLAAAGKRITDFETVWDDAEASMRPMNPAAWGNVDAATDAALDALRAKSPDPAKVKTTLAVLSDSLGNPAGSGPSAGRTLREVAGIAVTDANGHPIPCETMLGELRTAMANGAIPGADTTKASDLKAKATERCNADDDTRADAFAAEALALAAK